MSKGKKLLFKSNVILPWVIMICIVFTLQIQCEKGDQDDQTIKSGLSAEEILQMEMKFHKDLEKKFFKHLKDYYKEKKFELMADKMIEFGEKIDFYDLKGDVLKEKEICIKFWKEVSEKKVKDIDFIVLSLKVLPLAEPRELENREETIIATGHAVFVYRLIKEDEEGKITNSIGSGTYNARHPRACEW